MRATWHPLCAVRIKPTLLCGLLSRASFLCFFLVLLSRASLPLCSWNVSRIWFPNNFLRKRVVWLSADHDMGSWPEIWIAIARVWPRMGRYHMNWTSQKRKKIVTLDLKGANCIFDKMTSWSLQKLNFRRNFRRKLYDELYSQSW